MSASEQLLKIMLADGLSREEAERELAEIEGQLSSMSEDRLGQLERQLERASSMSEDQLRRGEHLSPPSGGWLRRRWRDFTATQEADSAEELARRRVREVTDDGEFAAVFGDLAVPPTAVELERLRRDPMLSGNEFYAHFRRQRLRRMADAARRREERLGLVSEPYRPGELDDGRRRLLAEALGLPLPAVPQRTVADVLAVRFEAARIVDSDASFEERRAQLQALQEANPDDDLSSEAEILAKLQSDEEARADAFGQVIVEADEADVSPPRREPIPESVRHEVWQRDEGRCIDCGSRERLEFDHIIPVSQGGSNSARNIELRCETCNLQKAATI